MKQYASVQDSPWASMRERRSVRKSTLTEPGRVARPSPRREAIRRAASCPRCGVAASLGAAAALRCRCARSSSCDSSSSSGATLHMLRRVTLKAATVAFSPAATRRRAAARATEVQLVMVPHMLALLGVHSYFSASDVDLVLRIAVAAQWYCASQWQHS